MTDTSKTDDLVRLAPGLKALLVAGASALAISMAPAYAQDTSDDDDVDVIEEADESTEGDAIVVTGSRLRKDTFSSISPLQVISSDVSREAGLIDPASILQNSTAATGQQIDDTFAGFVTDNGPGSSTVDLRGLGATRTLVLLNGRRVGPAGVEGAPRAPDLNLIPRALVDQYDLLLDGASSIYGSDAVAGVTNVILRKDFDGLELEFFGTKPVHDNGENYTVRGAYGFNTDRGFAGIGAEYTKIKSMSFADRPWTDGCDQHYEIDENGNIRTEGVGTKGYLERDFGLTVASSPCKVGRRIGNVDFYPVASTTYYTPGTTNIGFPNYSDTFAFSVPIDFDGDGVLDVDATDYSTYIQDNKDFDLIPESDRYSVMAYGEYVLEGEMNITPYFEALFSGRETTQNSAQPQFFPVVSADNPFNPCGTSASVDCGLELGTLFSNPNYRSAFFDYYGAYPEDFGYPRASGPVDLRPVVAVTGDRRSAYSKVEQFRFVGGARGDLPFISAGPIANWNFDVYGSYQTSTGEARRDGIRQDRLDLSLGNYSSAGTPCANDSGVTLDGSVTNGCVPVNLFAPSLYSSVRGEFATQAERDYLFDSRDFDTTYDQTVFSAFVSGDVLNLPAGSVGLGIGAEWRKDELDSMPDDIAADGLFFGFFADEGAQAESTIKELFAETRVPILANKPLAYELTLELSGRYTEVELTSDESGTETTDDTTYSAKLAYRPVSSLLLRGTYGTSFRAPNLGEYGLRSQTGFLTVFDPCIVPDDAYSQIDNTYNPALDDREAQTITACQREGVDPFTLGLPDTAGGAQLPQNLSTEIQSGAGTGLRPETSESYTAGFSFEQPWFDAFDLSLGMTYYDIEITDTIIEPTAGFVVADCFLVDDAATRRSAFCDRITRADGGSGTIDLINVGFINRDLETAVGIDYNMVFRKELELFETPMDFTFDLRLNQVKERNLVISQADGTLDVQEYAGEWGFPEWNGIGSFRLDVGDYRWSWTTNYLGAVSQDPDDVDEFDDAVDGLSDTCLGPTLGDVLCRDYAEADNYFTHTASLYYRGDSWTLGAGIRNVFDTAPPMVDSSEITARNNTPLGYGYDLMGRTYYVNIGKEF
ncbi:TonB-dependent receptor domain-containing protein [Parvularcula sp. LCG005]|uniref:TonB-dependent receptor domain-containing protein n=1 Tax=Parvularcula sp. LCG005 TaxID=3078805 RepID=UPI00294203BA|nr:TonB-dependent receptor [Parvularcula sp. LCG005]WOI52110.1 TonB-dependent receptor [Parvularcula sp. LCG005]